MNTELNTIDHQPISPKQKALPILIAFLATAILVGGGVFALEELRLSREIEKLQQEIFELKKANQAQVETDDMTDWKTYRNEKYRYEIKYPTHWIADVESIENGILWLVSEEREKKIKAGNFFDLLHDMEIRVYKSYQDLPNNQKENLSFADWVKQENNLWLTDKEMIEIDGIQGYKGIALGLSTSPIIYVEKDGLVYQFSGHESAMGAKILSTFKFLDTPAAEKTDLDQKTGVACLDNPSGFTPNISSYPEFYDPNNIIHKAVVLHRLNKRCQDDSVVEEILNGAEDEVIYLHTDERDYCNYICRSRKQEQCYLDGTFDTYYDEWCEDASGNRIQAENNS